MTQQTNQNQLTNVASNLKVAEKSRKLHGKCHTWMMRIHWSFTTGKK